MGVQKKGMYSFPNFDYESTVFENTVREANN